MALCALAQGGLGSERLSVLGPRLPGLAVFAPSLLGLSGMAAGLIVGLIRRPPGFAVDAWRRHRADADKPDDEAEHTARVAE